eukprot:824371-Prorocentrum_minimum.AAC.1
MRNVRTHPAGEDGVGGYGQGRRGQLSANHLLNFKKYQVYSVARRRPTSTKRLGPNCTINRHDPSLPIDQASCLERGARPQARSRVSQ